MFLKGFVSLLVLVIKVAQTEKCEPFAFHDFVNLYKIESENILKLHKYLKVLEDTNKIHNPHKSRSLIIDFPSCEQNLEASAIGLIYIQIHYNITMMALMNVCKASKI